MLTRGTFVGRASELALADQCLDDMLAGRPRVVLCEGQAGMGKSRLASEALSRAGRLGALTAWGSADDAAGAPPYWPWRQILRELSGRVDLAGTTAGQRFGRELARIAPEIFPDEPVPDQPAGSPEDRFRQFDALARLLREVSVRQPVAAVLDDVHWADGASLLLLGQLTAGLAGERLLLWVNSRDFAQEGPTPGTRWLRSPYARRFRLDGFACQVVREQLESIIGAPVTAAEAAEVHALTGGNPFFVSEVAQALLDRRAGRQADLITRGAVNAVAARLGELSAGCREVLFAAAVTGREFGARVVALMLDVPVPDCLRRLDEAERAGLVEADGGSPGDYQFTHALVRDAIEVTAGRADRVRLHRLAAKAIEVSHAGALERHVFELARHWAQAAVTGDPAEAVVAANWLRRAGDVAMAELAFEDAADWYRQALRAGGSELAPQDRCALLLAAGKALSRYGALSERLHVCLEAAGIARAHGRMDLIAEAAMVMEPVGQPGFDVAARRLCQEVLAAIGPAPAPLRARLTARFAETFIYLPDSGAARQASEQALTVAEQCGDSVALAAALRARQVVAAGPDGLDDRERLAARLLALSMDGADAQLELQARLGRIDVTLQRGDFALAVAEAEAAASCADQAGGPVAHFHVAHTRAVLAQAQGRFAEARRLADEAFALMSLTEHPARFPMRAAVLGVLGRHTGQDEESLAANGCVADPAEADRHPARRPGLIAALAKADVLLTAGRRPQAAAEYAALGSPAGWQPPPHVLLLTSAFGLELAIAFDARDDVAVLHDRLAPYRGHHVVCGLGAAAYLGPVELWLGRAACRLDRLDQAVADLAGAERTCRAAGAAGFAAESGYELAVALAARGGPGDRASAHRTLDRAASQAEELAMTPLQAAIADLGRRLRATESSQLTRREREVADLVASGMTNREIASRLCLSERTAQNHVQHILTKLSMANRSQLAVWAHQAGGKVE